MNMADPMQIHIRIKLNELFCLHRQLKLQIEKFWVSKRQFDKLRNDFRYIKNNGSKRIDLTDLNHDYFG